MNIEDLIGETTTYDKKRELERKDPLKPTFRSTATGFFVILPNLNKDFSMTVKGSKTTPETTPETTLETVTETVIETVTETVTERVGKPAAKLYRMILSKPTVTVSEMAKRMDLTVRGVRYHLQKLKDANLVRFVGNPKHGHWEGIEE